MSANNPRTPALDLIAAVVDPGSWHGWDEPVDVSTDDPGYRADLLAARERTGLDESVVTGEGTVGGRRVAVVACEFRFLAGSIGVAAGERLVRAVERATAEGLPLLAAPASGGTRMQEGTIAFLQMVKVTAAIADHKAAGLPYLVYLRHPTTGGVLASWGSLGHLTAAEPGALIGFLGPRVHEALYGEEFPQGVQVAENLLANGLVDAVLPAARLGEIVARSLSVLCGETVPAAGAAVAEVAGAPAIAPSAAESIRRSRLPGRPGVRELLAAVAGDVTPLSGTGAGERDPGMLLALARVGVCPASSWGTTAASPRIRTARAGARASRTAGRPARHAHRRRAEPATAQRRRHRRGRTLARGRRGRAGGGDRPLPRRPGHPARTHPVPAARPGRGRRRARAAPGGPGGRRPARMALPAAARGRVGHSPPHHRPGLRGR
ncbi:hypothetical protein GCM10020000_63740 [Streptomyces olivoverticillatus]